MHTTETSDFKIEETLLKNIYSDFNHRNMDAALARMQPTVQWPNGMEGGIEDGQDAVRNYWTRQWKMIDPHVEPTEFTRTDDGRTDVTVHQVVKDLSGNTMIDEVVHHIYTFESGLIQSMEIKK